MSIPIALLLATLSLQSIPSSINVAEAIDVRPITKTVVQIKNSLESGATLQVHCKDKNNDLDVHQIPRDQTYKFEFYPSFFGVTLYFCGFVWDNKLHGFDIYVQKRDKHACRDFVCLWDVKMDGPCLHTSSDVITCHSWSSQKALT